MKQFMRKAVHSEVMTRQISKKIREIRPIRVIRVPFPYQIRILSNRSLQPTP